MRVHTILDEHGDVIIIGYNFRFGARGAYVDNLSAGGIGVRVDRDSGILGSDGFDYRFQSYQSHPDSGIVFKGVQVPFWNEVKSVCSKAQKSLSFVMHYGMDVAISDTGPVVLEINAIPDLVGFEQINGPIFDKPEVWKAFKHHDLLINRPSRALY